jgi:hypothetical protein
MLLRDEGFFVVEYVFFFWYQTRVSILWTDDINKRFDDDRMKW